MEKIRVQKIISNNSNISRRKAEELIKQGRIKINKTIAKIGDTASSEDKIFVDDKQIKTQKKLYLAIDKEAGYVTSTKDPHEKTIMKLLPSKYKDKNLYPAGRLDKDTEGLLIMTNDGDFANQIMHPSNNIKKTYEGICLGKLSKKDIESLRNGIKLEEGIAKCQIKIIPEKEQTSFEIILETGWTRQIRRMFQEIGHEVIKLRRTKIGELHINDLKGKKLREYNKEEITKKIGFFRKKQQNSFK